jgi:MSHA pilin protein MshC
MVELVVTIAIVGILAAIAGPRFFSRNVFEARGFFDRATETVRYSQKLSVASRRAVFVCVTPTTIAASFTAGCASPLTNPANPGELLSWTAPSGVQLTGSSFSFTAPNPPTQSGGQPSTGAQVVIGVSSATLPGRQIVIERETGYVHN